MSRQPDLFDNLGRGASTPGQRPALSVSEFNERVAAYLQGLFPATFRIQGFVSGFNRSFAKGGHVYFELHEKDPDDETRDLARISLVIWRGTRQRLVRDIEALGGAQGELDDLQVYFEVSVNFWVQGGRLSLVVEGVDLEASLGAQKLDREQILRRLESEGLLARNKGRPLVAVPLRLILITSLESAAYHDFRKELSQAGMGFKLACIDSRVQGPEQEADMLAAFAWAAARADAWDAVVLIRGGGSRADLMGFDSEKLARAIAICPLPVLTGIGHEIDRSIADEVAHRAFKTPTAAAQFLVQRIEEWLAAMDEIARDLRREAERSLHAASRSLDRAANQLRHGVGQSLNAAARRLDRTANRVPHAVRESLSGAKRRVSVAESRLPAVLHQAVRLARMELRHLRGRMAPASRRITERKSKELEHRAERLRLVDPLNVMKRGFSLTFDEGGRLLRSVAGISPGKLIVTRLADGELESRSERVRAMGAPGREVRQGSETKPSPGETQGEKEA